MISEKELYHVHALNKYDELWTVGNEIKIDKSYKSIMRQRQENFNQIITFNDHGIDKKILFTEYITAEFNDIINNPNITIGDLEEIINILKLSFKMTYNANFFKIEQALENYRKEYCKSTPSRLDSIFLCDEDGLEYWQDTISNCNDNCEIETFKVLVRGNIFKSNEELLPTVDLNYKECLEKAKDYFHPCFKGLPSYTNEYMATGNIKILDKVRTR